jgi:hypothetical protein
MIKSETKEDNSYQDAPDITNKNFDQILKLSNLTEIKQILTSIKLAYFPFAGFVLKDPDELGLQLLYDYSEIFLKIKTYLDTHELKES